MQNRKEWNDWKWQLKNAIRDIDTLAKVVELDDKDIADLKEALKKFRMAISPHYASLMDRTYKRCPVRLQGIPRIHETDFDESDIPDQIGRAHV